MRGLSGREREAPGDLERQAREAAGQGGPAQPALGSSAGAQDQAIREGQARRRELEQLRQRLAGPVGAVDRHRPDPELSNAPPHVAEAPSTLRLAQREQRIETGGDCVSPRGLAGAGRDQHAAHRCHYARVAPHPCRHHPWLISTTIAPHDIFAPRPNDSLCCAMICGA